jgi:hypothetical protein
MATHLTATMRVIASHLHIRHVSVGTAREEVLELAQRLAQGVAGPESESLAGRLERATGCSIAELAIHAQEWPTE